MIQRIQSIFLLICSASFFSLFGVPFATSTESLPLLFSDMVYNIQDSPILSILCILGGTVSLIAIFLYNKRDVQLKLSYLTTVAAILLPLTAILLVYNEGTGDAGLAKINDQLGIYLPIIGFVFSLLASKYIKKDESTVRSMDRLR
ncbi:MAG: DUF4293 domain-containing protein [Saprospiraceae bacterium]